MLTSASFEYAVLRVVPRVERQEFLNVGVLVFCRERRYLEARVHLDPLRLHALAPTLDLELIRQHAEAVVRICLGDVTAGLIARSSQSERFHWLTAPRSTMLQTSPVHTGICSDVDGILDRLFGQLVL